MHTHSDFDDFAVETVEHDHDITSISGRISSIVPANKEATLTETCQKSCII